MTDDSRTKESSGRRIYGAERAKAFVDAVVAIAMTLLILPLMESMGEVAAADNTAADWFSEHQWQLTSFVLSFAIIAMFWINHHRMFALVERVSTGLLWVAMAWLLSIVWLPVATAMSGRMSDQDVVARSVYIGSMIVVCLLTLALRLYLRAHPDLHEISEGDLRHGVAVDLSMATLFAVALVIAVVFPVVGYNALFIMFLTGPAQRLFRWMLGAGRASVA